LTVNRGDANPIGKLLHEARARLPGVEEVECMLDGEAYLLTVSRAGVTASARLKARFWQEYLEGLEDNCNCIDHFFDHLARRLGEK
jgi:hypothetical protein